jgi:hypothetical protein
MRLLLNSRSNERNKKTIPKGPDYAAPAYQLCALAYITGVQYQAQTAGEDNMVSLFHLK